MSVILFRPQYANGSGEAEKEHKDRNIRNKWSGPRLNIKSIFPRYGIPILVRRHLYIVCWDGPRVPTRLLPCVREHAILSNYIVSYTCGGHAKWRTEALFVLESTSLPHIRCPRCVQIILKDGYRPDTDRRKRVRSMFNRCQSLLSEGVSEGFTSLILSCNISKSFCILTALMIANW